jgi:hypothetical protein
MPGKALKFADGISVSPPASSSPLPLPLPLPLLASLRTPTLKAGTIPTSPVP